MDMMGLIGLVGVGGLTCLVCPLILKDILDASITSIDIDADVDFTIDVYSSII